MGVEYADFVLGWGFCLGLAGYYVELRGFCLGLCFFWGWEDFFRVVRRQGPAGSSLPDPLASLRIDKTIGYWDIGWGIWDIQNIGGY